MFAFVLIANLLIGCGCLFVAWQVWRVKSSLAQASETLLSVEQAIYNCLHGAPQSINKGQMGIYQLRQKYQHLEIQLQRAQQVLTLLSFGQMLWQRQRLVPGRARSARVRG